MRSPSLTPTKGFLWPSHTFVESYNSQRQFFGHKRASTDVSGRTRNAPYSDRENYGYTLIRSDVETELLDSNAALPQMSSSSSGVRPRSSTVHLESWLRHRANEGEIGGPMAWVESTWFQALSGFIISLNAIIIGLETDIKSPVWFWVEQSLLIFFVFELSVRLAKNGVNFFQHEDDWVWNIFDFSIVMSGVFDTWIMPCISILRAILFHHHHGHGDNVSVLFMLMRMGRLLRIVRLFRLVRIVRPLFELAMGILAALQGMFWVLVFLIMFLYGTAILCTRMIGHGSMLDSIGADADELQVIKEMFNTVPDSMFTLFGTVSSWSLLKFVPLFDELPYLRPLFVLFYVYSAWALLAVMTGVVSENMIAIREQMSQEDKQREEFRRANITEHLLDVFRKADTDGSGTISREEFEHMLQNQNLIKKIQKNAHMQVSEMRELYDWLDNDGNGTITIDEFMEGFKWVNSPLRAKSLVKMQERVLNDLRHLESNVVNAVQSRSSEVTRLVAQPLRKVYAVTEQLQSIECHLTDLSIAVREQRGVLPTQQEIRDTYSRLSSKLDVVSKRLAEVEKRARNRNGTKAFE